MSAKDHGTGNEQQIQIEGGSGLYEDEVQRMVKEAEAHADEAHKLRELAEARNTAERLAYQTEKTLKEHRDKLEESDAATIEGRIMELRGVLESTDVDRDPAKTEALQRGGAASSPRRSTRRRAPQAQSARRPATATRPPRTRSSRTPTTRSIDEEEEAKTS